VPTDLPPGFRGTKPGKHKSVDPIWVSPSRLAPEPEREPLLAGQPLGIKILRLVVIVFLVAVILSIGIAAAAGAIAALLWVIP
jgi:hypothetical protein